MHLHPCHIFQYVEGNSKDACFLREKKKKEKSVILKSVEKQAKEGSAYKDDETMDINGYLKRGTEISCGI